MPDLDQEGWRPWIAHVCAAMGVDPARVDVEEIHVLTRAVAHGLSRPMAPVSAHLWGLALGADPDADPHRLRDALIASVEEDAH